MVKVETGRRRGEQGSPGLPWPLAPGLLSLGTVCPLRTGDRTPISPTRAGSPWESFGDCINDRLPRQGSRPLLPASVPVIALCAQGPDHDASRALRLSWPVLSLPPGGPASGF